MMTTTAKNILPYIIEASSPKTNHWGRTSSGLIIPEEYLPKKQPKAFDFFAGCGGFSCGIIAAGFHVVGACEIDKHAAHTYMVNLGSYPMKIHFDTPEREAEFEKYLSKAVERVVKKRGFIATSNNAGYEPDTFSLAGSGWIKGQPNAKGCEHFWIADIRNLTGKQILDALEMEVGELDLIVGGPPCQGFSKAGKRDESDPRNYLIFEYARMIVEMQPKTFVMEEVPEVTDMVTAEGIPILEQFMRIIADGDYAPFESLAKSLLGRKGAKAVLRREKKQKVKQREKKKTLGINKPPRAKATLVQNSLF